MKITAQTILTAGLAVAINISGSPIALGAGGKAKSNRVAQAPGDLNTTPVPIADPAIGAPTPLPAWTPTPLAPTPADQPSSIDAPGTNTAPPSSAPAAAAPAAAAPRSNLPPPNRRPMGMYQGEHERLDNLFNPKPRQLPVAPDGMFVPPTKLAPNASEGTDRFGIAPPPGTIGLTYKRRTRVIDDSKHPRVGIVEVQLPEEVDVTAVGLKSKWNGKVWRLESEPLLPGVPHIYEVKAQWYEGTEPQVRTVRLIMGRIVDLEF